MSDAWPMRRGDERSDYTPLERSSDGVGYVYFIGSPNGERIKIGYSGDPRSDARLRQHANGDAFGEGKGQELAIVRATRQAEGRLHSYFKPHLRAKREVYAAEPVIPYLAWLRDNYFVSTTWEEFQTSVGQIVIEANHWLPDATRVSDRRSEASLLTLGDPWAVLPSRVRTGDDYYTPKHFVECIRAALGGCIDLDPASHVMANEVIQAQRFFTKDQNGLSQPWDGRVFLNPPFSSWPEWVDKVLQELARGEVSDLITLGATRTQTAQYFERLLRRADALCIITGRTPFWGLYTESDSPTDGHFLLYFGSHIGRFVQAVTPLGPSWPKP
jgi:hypothetical protein